MTETSCTSSLPTSRVAGQGKPLTYRCGRIVGSSVWRVAVTSSNAETTSAGALCRQLGGAWRLGELFTRRSPATVGLHEVLSAINRGEGLVNPDRVNNGLALQVRTVEGGSIRSYRVFPHSHFRLEVLDEASRARFVEHMPDGLVLWYEDAAGGCADLRITLD